MDEKSIWNERQNKPSLIVDDLVQTQGEGARDLVYSVLLRRGVFKWLAVRRKLIALKDRWKELEKELLDVQKAARPEKRAYWRGYRKALIECRKEVRDLCHSPRWQVQDNDSRAEAWLREQKR